MSAERSRTGSDPARGFTAALTESRLSKKRGIPSRSSPRPTSAWSGMLGFDMPNVWLTRGGRTGEFENFALSAGAAFGGWNEPPDLSRVTTYEDLRAIAGLPLAAW